MDGHNDSTETAANFSLASSAAFSGFSSNDIARSRDFYGDILGLEVEQEAEPMGMLTLKLSSGANVLVYPKDDHQPASYTVLNFPVEDIDAAVAGLKAKGVAFEHYADMGHMDENSIARGLAVGMGPDIAWFKDPAGNTLAVMQLA